MQYHSLKQNRLVTRPLVCLNSLGNMVTFLKALFSARAAKCH